MNSGPRQSCHGDRSSCQSPSQNWRSNTLVEYGLSDQRCRNYWRRYFGNCRHWCPYGNNWFPSDNCSKSVERIRCVFNCSSGTTWLDEGIASSNNVACSCLKLGLWVPRESILDVVGKCILGYGFYVFDFCEYRRNWYDGRLNEIYENAETKQSDYLEL